VAKTTTMKNTILIALLFAFMPFINAQNPSANSRIESQKFRSGGDSIVYTIVGNDTIKTTEFHRNGKPHRMVWAKDSSYFFDDIGRLRRKFISIPKGIRGLKQANSIHFYANGRISEENTYSESEEWEKYYAENGLLIYQSHKKRDSRSNIGTSSSVSAYNYSLDRFGKRISASKSDTFMVKNKQEVRNIDTTFYENGRPMRIKTELRNAYFMTIQHFNSEGVLTHTVKEDSFSLIPFKDNVDCYYGLKNRRGDTIVRPHFDKIDDMMYGYWAAFVGNSCMVFTPQGAPITPPTAHLTNVERIFRIKNESPPNKSTNFERDKFLRSRAIPESDNDYFMFSDGTLYGVMRHDGTVVLPLQPHKLTNQVIGNGDYFSFEKLKNDTIIQLSFLNREGKPLFFNKLKGVAHTLDDYFLISEEPRQSYTYANTLGLGRGKDNKILLAPKFDNVQFLSRSKLYQVRIHDYIDSNETIERREGLFNPRTEKWIVDTTNFEISNNSDENDALFFVLKNVKTKKYGIVDTTGKYIAAMSFDSIGILDTEKGIFWTKKGGKFQILTIENGKMNLHKKAYQFLSPISFHVNYDSKRENFYYFLAKENDKWGLIDSDEKTIKPFEYDYASPEKGNAFLLVKNSQAECFDIRSLPNTTPDFPHLDSDNGDKKMTASYRVADNSDRVFFMDNAGKIMIPPQYKSLSEQGDNAMYSLVEDAQKKKKIIFFETGKVIDYPFDFKVELAYPNSRVLAVKDSAEFGYGIVSTAGKSLIPCTNFGVSIDPNQPVFFVKRDTPLINRDDNFYTNLEQRRVSPDSLNAEDDGWLMYNADGQLLDKKPFRFPIQFNDGIGVGLKENAFNLYKPDGSVLMPFGKNTEGSSTQPNLSKVESFNNIRRDRNKGFYALFRNQGLTPTMILTTKSGEIRVESGRYEGVSRFFDKYALVSAKGKIGLIDSFGREIIAPKDLRTYTEQFVDSLDIVNKIRQKKEREGITEYNEKYVELPINANESDAKSYPDSLKISAFHRASLWNLMLEKTLPTTIGTASDLSIERGEKVNAEFVRITENTARWVYEIQKISVADSTIGFVFRDNNYDDGEHQFFYNFYRRNARWEELKINDLLTIQGEKRWQFNEFLTQKIKALKDVSIDCSNASAFISQVENRFLLTQNGLDFCFQAKDSESEFVVVSFSWNELKPYLKMQISGH
jgi:hypothetical protein